MAKKLLITAIFVFFLLLFSGAAYAASVSATLTVPSNQTQPSGGGVGHKGAEENITAENVTIVEKIKEAVEEIIPKEEIPYYIGDFAKDYTYTKTIKPTEVWTFTYKNINYTIEATEIDDSFVKFRILSTAPNSKAPLITGSAVASSEPAFVVLEKGETKKIDLDADGQADITLTLNNIKGLKVTVNLKLINVPAELMVRKGVTDRSSLCLMALVAIFLFLLLYKKRKKEKKITRHKSVKRKKRRKRK